MPKKPKWQSNTWKIIVGLSVILGLIASALQIIGEVDFVNLLILPLYNFFVISIPLYSVPLSVIVFLIVLFILGGITFGSNILDDDYARQLAITCQTPQTTDFLNRAYERIKRMEGLYGSYSFENCLKLLENHGYFKYDNGKWEVTQKALDYIHKYHGG